MPKPTDEEKAAAELLGSGPTLADALGLDHPNGEGAGALPAHPLLSPDEVAAAMAKARESVEAKRRDAAIKAVIKAETERLEREEGLVTGDGVKDEMVTVHLDLAEHSNRIVLSGTPYWHGHTYTIPRHVADTLREIQSRGHDHQSEIEGKNLADRFRRPRNTVIDVHKGGAVVNAPQYQVGA